MPNGRRSSVPRATPGPLALSKTRSCSERKPCAFICVLALALEVFPLLCMGICSIVLVLSAMECCTFICSCAVCQIYALAQLQRCSPSLRLGVHRVMTWIERFSGGLFVLSGLRVSS